MQIKTKSGLPLQLSLQRKFEKAFSVGEYEMLNQGIELLQKSNPEVPVDTGALQSSGGINLPTRNAANDRSRMEVFYGDTAVINPKHGRSTNTYALIQHEENPNGHDHFLTDPLDDMKAKVYSAIKRAFLRGLRKF